MKEWGNVECIQTIGGVDVPTLKCLEAVYSNILTVVISLSLLALFVMLLIGGFRFLTSGGDQKATASAQQTMTYAIIGMVLLALAYIIFRIIEAYTGVPILLFEIPSEPWNRGSKDSI